MCLQKDNTDLVRYEGTFLVCNGYDEAKAKAALEQGRADLVVFGKLFIANPDLPDRFKEKKALNAWDEATFYTPGEKGYVDYAVLGTSARLGLK